MSRPALLLFLPYSSMQARRHGPSQGHFYISGQTVAGIFNMDEQPNDNRPSIPTWVWIITIFAVILGLQLWLSGRFSGPEQITPRKLLNTSPTARSPS